MDKKNVLVTGGAGFIGSFLCEALVKAGNHVICVDELSTGHIRNIENLLRSPDFQFIKADIVDGLDIESYHELEPFKIKFLGIQEIYHLAMPTAVKGYERFCMQALLTNSVGTRNVLELAVKYRAKALLASSATTYGSQDGKILEESMNGTFDHLSPRGCFNEGKRFCETMFATYEQVYGIDAKIARIFRTYGPRMPLFHGHQIPDFALNILDEKPIHIIGDAQSKTALVYISDVVDGLLRLMKAPKGIGPVNFGSDVEISIPEIARTIMSIIGKNVDISYEPQMPHMIPLGLPSLSKAREALGWIPLVRLQDGLQKTVDYIRANKLLLTSGE